MIDAFWLAEPMAALRRARDAGRFPPALLIHAAPGMGGELLAQYAAQLALCRSDDPPCDRCRDCQRVQAGQHPDQHQIGLIEDSKQLRVEQIRELSAELALSSHGGGAAVAVLQPADMTESAANALLKTLEEPRPGVSIVLVSATPSALPATIISRCMRLRVAPPAPAAAAQWLRQQRGAGDWEGVLAVMGGAPLRALQADPAIVTRLRRECAEALSEAAAGRLDIAGTAAHWARGEDVELRLACVENWVTACIDALAGARTHRDEKRATAHLPAGPPAMNIAALIRFHDSVRELARLVAKPINKGIAIEQLLWQLARAGATAPQV